MAQNYFQTSYVRSACTQAVVACRTADAILAIARFAAAFPVAPAALSVAEQRKGSPRGPALQRLAVQHRGCKARPRSQRSRNGREVAGGPGRGADRSAGHRARADRYS
jgi:hypothetical protein